MRKRIGRPQTALRDMDVKLADFGGTRGMVMKMVDDRKTASEIVERMRALTDIHISVRTMNNWIRRWSEDIDAVTPAREEVGI